MFPPSWGGSYLQLEPMDRLELNVKNQWEINQDRTEMTVGDSVLQPWVDEQ
jgi:hypothetical protein